MRCICIRLREAIAADHRDGVTACWSFTLLIAGCLRFFTFRPTGAIRTIRTLRHHALKPHVAGGPEQVGADLALSSSRPSAAWCRRRAWRPAQAAGQFCLVRCFNMKLQAASASSNVLKGEPPILIAPPL
jgi:hypothetical protein